MSHIWYAVYTDILFGSVFDVAAACSRNHGDQQSITRSEKQDGMIVQNGDPESLNQHRYLLHPELSIWTVAPACMLSAGQCSGAGLGPFTLHPNLPPRGTHPYLQWHFDAFWCFRLHIQQIHCCPGPICPPQCLPFSIALFFSSKCRSLPCCQSLRQTTTTLHTL